MDLALTANLDGLVAGTVKIQGKAAGSVLVRNPRFSMAFSHPRTVRFGELYDAYVTILNTGLFAALPSTLRRLVRIRMKTRMTGVTMPCST